MVFSVIKQKIFNLGDSKSKRASKLHYWFKSYRNFAKWVDFAYWWNLGVEGLRSTGLPCLVKKNQFIALQSIVLQSDLFIVNWVHNSRPGPGKQWLCDLGSLI